MSHKVYDYHCDDCDESYPNCFVRSSEVDKQRCGKCKGLLRRLMPGPTTTFKFGDRSAIKSKKEVSFR